MQTISCLFHRRLRWIRRYDADAASVWRVRPSLALFAFYQVLGHVVHQDYIQCRGFTMAVMAESELEMSNWLISCTKLHWHGNILRNCFKLWGHLFSSKKLTVEVQRVESYYRGPFDMLFIFFVLFYRLISLQKSRLLVRHHCLHLS